MMFFTGCGIRVEVPTAHVGKIKTANGLSKDMKAPSSFRLPLGWFRAKPELIIVETSHFAKEENMELFMPKDKLKLNFDIRGTFSVSKSNANDVFENLVATQSDENRVLEISAAKVYDVYGKQVIRTKARSVLSKYTIKEILDNMDGISLEIKNACQAELDSAPLDIIRIGLANVKLPSVIVDAEENAKKREVAIQQAEANKQVSLKESEAALEVALKQQEIDLLEAETQVLVDKKLAEGVSEAFITQRSLKALEKLSTSNNKTIILLPYEAMKNPALLLGAMQEVNAKGE